MKRGGHLTSLAPGSILIQNDHVQLPEEADMDEELREEDAADVAARKRDAAKAREEAELRQRSQVQCIIRAFTDSYKMVKAYVSVAKDACVDSVVCESPRSPSQSLSLMYSTCSFCRCYSGGYQGQCPSHMGLKSRQGQTAIP
jgi:hypothetical protein